MIITESAPVIFNYNFRQLLFATINNTTKVNKIGSIIVRSIIGIIIKGSSIMGSIIRQDDTHAYTKELYTMKLRMFNLSQGLC